MVEHPDIFCELGDHSGQVLGISCTAGLLVTSVAIFPQSRLYLFMNRCFFPFLGRLNGSPPPVVPEADLSIKLQNGHQSGTIHSCSDTRLPARLKRGGLMAAVT